MSSRHLDQHEYIHLDDLSSRHFRDVLQKHQHEYIHLDDLSSKLFQDVFKMSCKNVKTSSRRLEDVLNTFSERLAKMIP